MDSPIDGYHAEIENARGAAEHVEADPDLAHGGSEGPAALYLKEHSHRHNEQSDAEIAHR